MSEVADRKNQVATATHLTQEATIAFRLKVDWKTPPARRDHLLRYITNIRIQAQELADRLRFAEKELTG